MTIKEDYKQVFDALHSIYATSAINFNTDYEWAVASMRKAKAAIPAAQRVAKVLDNTLVKPRMSAIFDKDGVVVNCRELLHPEGHDLFTLGDAMRCNERRPDKAPHKADVLYSTPQFDRAIETPRRRSAVELLLSMGFVWENGKWVHKGVSK